MPDFETDLKELFAERICMDNNFAKRIYAALTNIIWKNGVYKYSVTFRYAGSLLAEIQGKGNYMDWYCSAGEGIVDTDIAEALDTRGWVPTEYD